VRPPGSGADAGPRRPRRVAVADPARRHGGLADALGPESLALKELRFTGNTAFSREQLLDASLDLAVPGGPVDANAKKVRDLVGTDVTLEQLEQARVAVTLLYVNAGYINSGAVLDDQPVGTGRSSCA
jgi:hemolysin activation/secretion protein